MPPVKPSQRTHYKDEQRSQVIPSDVADTMNEIRDGLNVIFDDSVRRVKGTADMQVGLRSFMQSRGGANLSLVHTLPTGSRTTTSLL